MDVIQGIIARCISIDGIKTDELFQDPDDAVFYDIAMEAKLAFDESYLVKGNTKHFPDKPFVVTPKEMLDILNS